VTSAGRRVAWLLSLALAAAGGLAAHGLAYRIAEPDPERRHHLLEETGHGYLDLHLVGSLLVALVLVGFAGRVLAGGHRAGAPPVWFFALAPLLSFACQEHAEHALTGSLSAGTPLESVFLVGLVLQLPFALAALLVARALLAAADALVVRLGSPPYFAFAPDTSLVLRFVDWSPAAPILIGARGQRAPPRARRPSTF
jgi:hypothetical protein